MRCEGEGELEMLGMGLKSGRLRDWKMRLLDVATGLIPIGPSAPHVQLRRVITCIEICEQLHKSDSYFDLEAWVF
jgi:hypothetical protein